MAEIKVEFVSLNVADGTRMRAYVARPQGVAPRAGLLVFQEAFGVNAHIRDVTERFAREGYVAIAPELYHRSAEEGFEGDYANFESVLPHRRVMTDQGTEADVESAFAWLTADPETKGRPMACVGFCMGGRVSFLANSVLPLDAAVSFYGGGIGPNPTVPHLLDRTARLRGPMLFFWGGLDKHIGPEQTRAVADALTAAGKRFVNVEISDADHGFFCDARPSYNAAAAQQAWVLTLEFLQVHAGP
jgi:carboxymethylenebutenolidase